MDSNPCDDVPAPPAAAQPQVAAMPTSASYQPHADPPPIPPPIPPVVPSVTMGSAEAPLEGEIVAQVAAPSNIHPILARKLAERERGATRFGWIVGSSVVNAVFCFASANFYFPMGLALTYLHDVVVQDRIHTVGDPLGHIAVALAIDAIPLTIFYLLGRSARKGQSWAFVVGAVLYLLDGGLFIMVQEWFGLALHAWALYGIFTGWQASRQINAWIREADAVNAAATWQSEAVA